MNIDFRAIAEQAVGRAMLDFQPRFNESCERYANEKSWMYAPGKALADNITCLLIGSVQYALETYHKTVSGSAFLLSPERQEADHL